MLQKYIIDKEHKTFAQAQQLAKKGEAINQINEWCENDKTVALAVALDKANHARSATR